MIFYAFNALGLYCEAIAGLPMPTRCKYIHVVLGKCLPWHLTVGYGNPCCCFVTMRCCLHGYAFPRRSWERVIPFRGRSFGLFHRPRRLKWRLQKRLKGRARRAASRPIKCQVRKVAPAFSAFPPSMAVRYICRARMGRACSP